MTAPESGAPAGIPPVAAWGVAVGLCLFAMFRWRPMPVGALGLAGLLGTAVCLAAGVIRTGDGWRDAFGLRRPRSPAGWWLVAGAMLGILLGAAFRVYRGVGPWPATLRSFVVLAAAIGAVEELVYRGFVQTGLRGSGRIAAVVIAAGGHTAYKCLLFVWRPGVAAADLALLAAATFLVGIGFGYLRETGRSIWPPVLAHAGFDIMVYGAVRQAPWWVWG